MLKGIESLNFIYLSEIADLFEVTVSQLMSEEIETYVRIAPARARLLHHTDGLQSQQAT